MQLPTSHRQTLTGRVRVRSQALTGKIVMQVEVIDQLLTRPFICPPPPGCEDVEGWNKVEQDRVTCMQCVMFWRDATANDMLHRFTLNIE